MNIPNIDLIKKRLQTVLSVIFLGFLLYFSFRFVSYHFQLINHPFPLEYREGAILLTTDLLLKGNNPFSLGLQPAYTNMYGILYNLIVYPFAKLGIASLFIHRLITAIFVWLACLFLFWIIHRKGGSILYAAAASLLFYAVLLFPMTTTALVGPHSLGLFLFLVSIFWPERKNYSFPSLIVSIIAGLLAFYAKAYFILGLPIVACYLFLFVSKKKGIIYGLLFVVSLAASIILIDKTMECYFNNTFFINMNVAQDSLEHARNQFAELIHLNRELLVILGLILVSQVINFSEIIRLAKGGLRMTIMDFNKPLFSNPLNLSFFCLLFGIVIIYFKLGRHGGSWMAYLFHLITPFFLVFLFTLMKPKRWDIIFMPLVVMSLFNVLGNFNINLNQKIENWQKVKDLISQHQVILNSPAIVPILVEQHKNVYESGHSEYFKVGAYRLSPLVKKIFPTGPKGREVILRHYAYLNEVVGMIKEKKFDLIMVTEDYSPMLPAIMLQYYDYQGSIQVLMPHFKQNWNLAIFTPK